MDLPRSPLSPAPSRPPFPTPTPRVEEWRSWPSVRAHIPNLPEGVTTYEIHKNLHRFGTVEFIRIEETRQGNFARLATITFKPPPPARAPWDRVYAHGIDFNVRRQDSQHTFKVKVLYAQSQPSNRLVESPVRRGVKYDPEVTLDASSIDFGYLVRPESMVVKATRQSVRAGAVRLMLNLNRLEMEVHFPVTITSKGKATERSYRFFVALDEQFSLAEVQNNGASALIIQLNNPPWYSRQLKEAMQMSHDAKSFRWSADDTWSRQTDIVDDKEAYNKINSTPVSVQKHYNSINIARWTTFRLTIKPSTDSSRSLNQFLTALTDFNIQVKRKSSFQVGNEPGHIAACWNLLDATGTRSWSEEFSLPPRLDFDLRYQLEVCISKGWLNEYLLTREFLERLLEMPKHRAKQMLVHVDYHQKRVYDPMSIFTDLRFTKPVRDRAIPSNCAQIYSATVTATGIVFHTPSVEITNRIVRKYSSASDHFLRVRFEDDDYRGRTRLYPATNGRMKLIFERVRRTLQQGIVLGDRHYEFLAWGNSQLREHGAYFFATSHNPRRVTVNDIRRDMGIFDHEKVVAKRAARMGQCFSTTKPIRNLTRNSWRKDPIPDIKNGQYTFTDGVGKISSLAAQVIHTELKLSGSQPPSAFQFRLGGCKGVLAVDPRLTGIDIKIRPSQWKFDSESDELEIIRIAEFWQPFLNRQLILVLSALGISDTVFLQKQQKCIDGLNAALSDDTVAIRALREMVDPNLITLSIANMIESGLSQVDEPFVASLVRLWGAWTLKYLKEKAKIPISQGAFVLGVADETGTLRGHVNEDQPRSDASREEKEAALPEIFLQYTDPQDKGVRRIIEGVCIIARNPSLHRGDIRVVKAVNPPCLRHLCDVVVMPSAGDRDLPSMCSGGDLDGDDYIVIWDPELLPAQWNAEPFHYSAPEPVKKEQVSIGDIINFFYDYMQNDFLGRIAHAHLAAADFMDDGIDSEQCLKLIELHSMAVDYPKTGVPAEMTKDLERSKWPHFMEKKRAGGYHSRKILGQLYDAVEEVKFEPHLSGTFDPRILAHAPHSDKIECVSNLKKSYDESLRRIMAQHQIRSEFEVWSTFVLSHSKAAGDYKFHEEIGQHAKTLKEQYYDAFCREAGGNDMEKLTSFAITAYHITHDELQQSLQSQRNLTQIDEDSTVLDAAAPSVDIETPFISFPWVLQETLQKIAKHTVIQDDGKSVQFGGDFSPSGPSISGDYLPDPYVPTIVNPDSAQDMGLIKDEQTALEAAIAVTPIPSPASPSRKLSLKDLPPIRPPPSSEDSGLNEHSPSDHSSMVSSAAPSMISSGKSLSISPDEPHAALSVLSRSSVMPESTSRGVASSVQDSQEPPTQVHTENTKSLRDPGMMTEADLRALTGDDDDDEDFTF